MAGAQRCDVRTPAACRLRRCAVGVEDAECEDSRLACDLFGSCDDVVEVGGVSEEESFGVDRLAPDLAERVDCVLSCGCGEDHGLHQVPEVDSDWLCVVVWGDDVDLVLVGLDVDDVEGAWADCDVFSGGDLETLGGCVECELVFHCVSPVLFGQVLLCKIWLPVSGGGASSQVSPVRAPEALSRSERRLDGSSGTVATPAKAGDALPASAPGDFVMEGARSRTFALGEMAWLMRSEVLRRLSWDVAPVDAEGVPC